MTKDKRDKLVASVYLWARTITAVGVIVAATSAILASVHNGSDHEVGQNTEIKKNAEGRPKQELMLRRQRAMMIHMKMKDSDIPE